MINVSFDDNTWGEMLQSDIRLESDLVRSSCWFYQNEQKLKKGQSVGRVFFHQGKKNKKKKRDETTSSKNDDDDENVSSMIIRMVGHTLIDIRTRMWLNGLVSQFFQLNFQTFRSDLKSIHLMNRRLGRGRIIVTDEAETFASIRRFIDKDFGGKNRSVRRKRLN